MKLYNEYDIINCYPHSPSLWEAACFGKPGHRKVLLLVDEEISLMITTPVFLNIAYSLSLSPLSISY
jgi:hypothetical protein